MRLPYFKLIAMSPEDESGGGGATEAASSRPTSGIDPKAHAEVLARAQRAESANAERETAAKAAADAKAAAAAQEAAQARAAEDATKAARSTLVEDRLKAALVRQHLGNIIDPDLLTLAPKTQLTEDLSALTPESVTALKEWREKKAHMFKASAAGMGTSVAAAGALHGASLKDGFEAGAVNYVDRALGLRSTNGQKVSLDTLEAGSLSNPYAQFVGYEAPSLHSWE